MGQIRLYVDDSTRRTLDELPAEVSRSELLRIGLAAYRAHAESCRHPRVRCLTCGSTLGVGSGYRRQSGSRSATRS